MPETEVYLEMQDNDRRAIRDTLIMEFLKEESGTGNGELTSVYYYYVEKTIEGIDIYLKRPARLNKGMDFEVHAEHIIFHNESQSGNIRRSSRLNHLSILYDLEAKKEEDPDEYKKVKKLIDNIYNCKEVTNEEMRVLSFNSGFPIELILKIIKWLFIEQDVTYWNWSGRNMFYAGIIEI